MPAESRPSGPGLASPALGSARCELILFGPPQVLRDGAALAVNVRKTVALLAYLAIEGRTARRRLADLLWPDLDEASGRSNLRRALHRLRAAGLGDAIAGDDEHVELAGVESDLAAFARALAAGEDEVAESLARRPLLDGLDVDDAPAFAEWLQHRRDHAAKAWRAAAARRAAACESTGHLAEAIALHERLLDAEPLREETWRDLMRLHDARGDRGVALALYERCKALLRDELHLEPLPQTRRLAERIAARGELPAETTAERAAPAPFDARAIPFVARDRELAALAARTEAVIFIEGEAGVGKSRLALEAWARRAREQEGTAPEPLLVRFAEMSSSTPFHAIADALRAPAVAARLASLAKVWRSDLARLLPEWGEACAAASAAAAAADPAEARARLLEALAQALAVGSGGSQTVVFDDLQWADASSLELMAHLAHRHPQAPATLPRVLATARSAELSLNAAAARAVSALAAEGTLARLPVAPFDDWSMLQLVRRLSGSEGGVRFAARLNDATGGNPFFALETIRTLIEAGELRTDPEQGWSTRYDETTTDYAELPLPASVVEAVRARVARLGPATVRVLETAALAEDGSTLAELQGATALSDWEALEGIERAIDAQIVAREGEGYRFVHDLVRAAIAGSLGVERRRLSHARLAAALEPTDAAPARIAAHWQAAGAMKRARQAWVRAAEAAAALHAYREAAWHFERAGDLADDDEEALAQYDNAVQWMYLGALDDEAARLLRRMLVRAEGSGAPNALGKVLIRQAEYESRAQRHAVAERLALRAAQSEFDDVRFRVQTFSLAGYCAHMLDRPADAFAAYRRALAVAVEGGSRRAEAMMAAAASSIAVHLYRFDESEQLGRQALAAAAADIGTIAHTQALSNASFVLRALGRRAQAETDLRQAVDISRATERWLYLRIYLANLCETLVDDGQGEAALRCHAEMTASPELRDHYLVAFTRIAVAEFVGELGDAIVAADRAIALADQVEDFSDRREARLLAAQLLASIGAPELAAQRVDEAAVLVHPDAQGTLQRVVCHRAGGRIAGDPHGARTLLRAAVTEPSLERLAAPAVEATRVLIGHAELALGDAPAARQAVEGTCHSVALESEAALVRLAAARLDGQGLRDAEAGLHAALESGRLPALSALTALRALAPAAGKGGTAIWRRRTQAAAQRLADSLRSVPPLQAAFIRLHRDLLT